MPHSPRARERTVLESIEVSASVVLVLFAVFYLNGFLGGALNQFGILPRNAWGALGIIFSPLLHYNQAHLTTNATSLLLLLIILFLHREYRPGTALVSIWLLSGLGTWLIGRSWSDGRPVVHIGASGVIYGVVTYLVAAGWWLRTWKTVLWSLAILFFYGGIFYGMLPQPGVVSWEGHLAGALAGILVARRQHR